MSPANILPLNEVLHRNARDSFVKAVEAELNYLSAQYSESEVNAKNAVLRNYYLSERVILTSVGDISVTVPEVRDRSRQ